MTEDQGSLSESQSFDSYEYKQTGQKNKIKKKRRGSGWSVNEYNTLISLVRKHGEEWDIISRHLGNKTSKQCMQKFKNSQRSAKKGNWTEEEN